MEAIKNRYDFSILFEVINGNPNGDPDAGNMPRIDPETGHGLVTDVCLKRKIRNYIDVVKSGEDGYRIYMKGDVPLNQNDAEACKALGTEPENLKGASKKDPNIDKKLRNYMCENFFDIRAFGAVMTTFVKGALNCGQVKGPIQLGFAKSIDPICTQEVTITRSAITTEKDAEEKKTEMGRKYIVPYGLYRVNGSISPNLAQQVTGLNDEDLELFWQAVLNMFELDRSAARGEMAVRDLFIFKHDSALGKTQDHKLYETITVQRKPDVTAARSYYDYVVHVEESDIPDGVTLIRM